MKEPVSDVFSYRQGSRIPKSKRFGNLSQHLNDNRYFDILASAAEDSKKNGFDIYGVFA